MFDMLTGSFATGGPMMIARDAEETWVSGGNAQSAALTVRSGERGDRGARTMAEHPGAADQGIREQEAHNRLRPAYLPVEGLRLCRCWL